MIAINRKPIFSDTYTSVADFLPENDCCYIHGESVEERSTHIENWRHNAPGTIYYKIVAQDKHSFAIEVNGNSTTYALRSSRQLSEFTSNLAYSSVYLDITGLNHSTWAPLLKHLLIGHNVKVVYVEPFDYRPSLAPTEGEIFDLSEKTEGIAPIPGYISLSDVEDEKTCLVPLIGFEGARFSHVIEQVQPPGEKIFPIVGVPGFKPEYPYNAYLGNKIALLSSQSYRQVRFATANCPFSAYYAIDEIASENDSSRIKVAPIGTKPHALGAILYALIKPDVEVVYDHPIRKPKRTEGSANLHVYHISKFFNRAS